MDKKNKKKSQVRKNKEITKDLGINIVYKPINKEHIKDQQKIEEDDDIFDEANLDRMYNNYVYNKNYEKPKSKKPIKSIESSEFLEFLNLINNAKIKIKTFDIIRLINKINKICHEEKNIYIIEKGLISNENINLFLLNVIENFGNEQNIEILLLDNHILSIGLPFLICEFELKQNNNLILNVKNECYHCHIEVHTEVDEVHKEVDEMLKNNNQLLYKLENQHRELCKFNYKEKIENLIDKYEESFEICDVLFDEMIEKDYGIILKFKKVLENLISIL